MDMPLKTRARTLCRSLITVFIGLLPLLCATTDSQAQSPIYLSVHTNSDNDTLIANRYGIIHFKVDSGNTDAIVGITWPLLFSYSNGNILGSLSDSGVGANVGFVPWNGPVSNSFTETPEGPTESTIFATRSSTEAPFGFEFSEQWRISVIPSDTGQITIDTSLAITATDTSGQSIPVVWQHATITVAPYCPSGDLNEDGILDAADLYILRTYVQQNGPPPPSCEAHADSNCSGAVEQIDIIRLLHFVFVGDQALCYSCALIDQGVWTCD